METDEPDFPWCLHMTKVGSSSYEGYVTNVADLKNVITAFEDHFGVTYSKRDTRGLYEQDKIGKIIFIYPFMYFNVRGSRLAYRLESLT